MKRAVIIYGSKHHGNTRKLVETISAKHEIDLIDAEKQNRADLSGYDLIGFASGIDFGKFYPYVEDFLKENLPPEKKVFFMYTCARTSPRFTESMKAAALDRKAVILGEYGCRGYNTYGPWKLVGGMNRNHPDGTELAGAVSFFESIWV